MRSMILAFVILFSGIYQTSNISEVRKNYKEAAEKEEAAKKLMELTENSDKQPVLLGYKAASHMLMAKYVANPFSKLSHFNRGKDMFSEAIEADKDNIELRFLRYAVQSEAPAFLGYRDNLEEDKNIILTELKNINDEELHTMISTYLLSSKYPSEAEKARIRN